MSVSFLAPQFLWALLSIPLVVLLHFIRARKRQQQVSALFLWQQAKEMAVAKRRFSPSWLLLLQLLFALLVSLALSQPSLTFEGAKDRVLVIDASASMAAVDAEGERLAQAVRIAKALPGRAARTAVIRAGLDATVVQPLTQDSQLVSAALDALVAADEEADLARAIALASAIAPDAELHVFSDNDLPVLDANTTVQFHPVGSEAFNAGISTFDIGLQQAYVAVVSNHPRPQQLQLEILQDNQVLAQSSLLVPANGQANITFPLDGANGFYEARITPAEWDALALDNVAFAGTRDLRVVLREPSEALERVLRSIPNVDVQVRPNANLAAPDINVWILTGALPEDITKGNYLLFNPADSNARFETIRDWDRSHPLLRFVDLTETIVGLPETPLFTEEEGEVLARTADLTPVLLYQSTPDLSLIKANFHPSQTDMINRIAFPLLMTNIMNAFREEDQLALGTPLTSNSNERIEQAGLYQLNGRIYSSSLLNATESRLQVPAPQAETSTNTADATAQQVRSLGIWLTVIALVALTLEWLLWWRSRAGWVSSAS